MYFLIWQKMLSVNLYFKYSNLNLPLFLLENKRLKTLFYIKSYHMLIFDPNLKIVYVPEVIICLSY